MLDGFMRRSGERFEITVCWDARGPRASEKAVPCVVKRDQRDLGVRKLRLDGGREDVSSAAPSAMR